MSSFAALHYSPCAHQWQVIGRLRSPVRPVTPSPMFMCYYRVKCIHCPQVTVWDIDNETGEHACDIDPKSEREFALNGTNTCQQCRDCGNWKRLQKKA